LIINKTPFEFLNNLKLNIDYIWIIGSLTYILDNKCTKLDTKLKKGILVGFEFSNNYLIFISKDNKVYNIRDVKILENKQYFNNKPEDYPGFIVDIENIALAADPAEIEEIALEISAGRPAKTAEPKLGEETVRDKLCESSSDIDKLNRDFYLKTLQLGRIRNTLKLSNLSLKLA